MLSGLNHNVRFKGKIYHVQTEDSGKEKPHVTTILYEGGVILARKRTSYADLAASDDLETAVSDIMRKQHKEMLRLLKSGELGRRDTEVPDRPEGGERGTIAPSRRGESLDEAILDPILPAPGRKQPGSPSDD